MRCLCPRPLSVSFPVGLILAKGAVVRTGCWVLARSFLTDPIDTHHSLQTVILYSRIYDLHGYFPPKSPQSVLTYPSEVVTHQTAVDVYKNCEV